MAPFYASNLLVSARKLIILLMSRKNMTQRTMTSSTKKLMDFGRAGELKDSMKVFDEMPEKNQVSRNLMLKVLIESNQLDKARQLFREMPHCSPRTYTLMITALSRSGCVAEAREVFDSIPICDQNVILWTSMLSCYTHNQNPLIALKLFVSSYGDFFSLKVIPNSFTLSIILKACLDVHSFVIATQIHGLVVKLLDEGKETVFVQNSLIDLHTKLGSLADAEKIFNGLKWKNLSSVNIMMDGYARHMMIPKAQLIFESMGERDTLSYNIMMSGFAESGHPIQALELFLQLVSSQSGQVEPNTSTYTIVLTVCATFTMLEFGMQVHAFLHKLGIVYSNIYTGNSLINMYAKCGSTKEMRRLFMDMPKRDSVSWNTLILGLGQSGKTREALEFAEEVLKLGVYNESTFIALLNSCSHGGLVDQGIEYFSSMTRKYGTEPTIDHYSCVIDMLGRAGRIVEAHDLLLKMPFSPNAVIWTALLSASLAHSNEEIGEIAARELHGLEPSNASSYVMLAKLYGRTGQIEKSKLILGLMSKLGLKKEQGRSWILKSST